MRKVIPAIALVLAMVPVCASAEEAPLAFLVRTCPNHSAIQVHFGSSNYNDPQTIIALADCAKHAPTAETRDIATLAAKMVIFTQALGAQDGSLYVVGPRLRATAASFNSSGHSAYVRRLAHWVSASIQTELDR